MRDAVKGVGIVPAEGTVRKDIHDAVVVGGGIVGLTVASALAGVGRRVALVERAPPVRKRGRLGFDLRTLALTPASAEFAVRAAAGNGSTLALCRMAPIKSMRVWEYDGAASLAFDHATALARVVEASAVTTALWHGLRDRVDVVAPARVVGVEETGDRVTLTVRHEGQEAQGTEAGEGRHEVNAAPTESRISAALVIAADGERSAVRELSGVRVRRDKPRLGAQRALATIAETNCPHADTAWQRFGATGPVALLPLADEHAVSVIWSTSAAVNARLSGLSDDAFIAALEEETEGVAGGFRAVDQRVSFPLAQSLCADLNPTPRTLIIGDAARTLHPLAGQGVNLGLEDARGVVEQARGPGDLGGPGRWRAFARARRQRSKAMLALMRALLAAYCAPGASNPWLRLARNTAIRGIDASAMVKSQLIREALGIGPFSAG